MNETILDAVGKELYGAILDAAEEIGKHKVSLALLGADVKDGAGLMMALYGTLQKCGDQILEGLDTFPATDEERYNMKKEFLESLSSYADMRLTKLYKEKKDV